MDDLTSLLKRIHESGSRVRVDGDQLRLKRHSRDSSDDYVARLTERKADLISYLRAKCASLAPNVAPLTCWQEWHWRIMLEEGTAISDKYMVPIALMLEGPIDARLLAQNIDMLVEKHEALRTRIVKLDSIAMQHIDEPTTGQLRIEAVERVPVEDIEDSARANLVRFFSERVDACAGPLFKAKLLVLEDNRCILAVCIHHMVTDVESLTRLFSELWRCYFNIDETDQLRPRSEQFQLADYAAWQRSSDFDWHESFWRKKLQGARPVAWPIDEETASRHRFCAGFVSVDFREGFAVDLQRVAHDIRTIPGLVLLSAYAILISYWANQADFVVPFAVNGRTEAKHADALGWFSYPLLIRLNVDRRLTFAEFTKNVVHEFMLGLENADGGRLLSCQLPYMSEGTLFRWATVGEHRDAVSAKRWSRDVKVKRFPVQMQYTKHHELRLSRIILSLNVANEGVSGRFRYRADLFSEERMSALAKNFQEMCEKLMKNPDAVIGESVAVLINRGKKHLAS